MGKMILTNDNGKKLTIDAGSINSDKSLEPTDFKYIRNTIADMLTIQEPEDGDVCFVKGYHSVNDSGGGTFIYSSTEDKSNHNGGTIIDNTKAFPSDWADNNSWFNDINSGNGCWVRNYSGSVNVKWFGAKGDGSSDGSTFTSDDTISIQSALDWTNSIGSGNPYGDYYGGEVFLPKGNYTISSTLNLYPNTILSGEGIDTTEIQARLNSNISGWAIIDIPDRGYSESEKINRNVEIKNLSINGNDINNENSNIVGITLQNTIYSKLTNIEVKMCDSHGLKIKNQCSNILALNCIFRDSNSAQVVIENSSAIFFNGGEIRTGSSFGVLLENEPSRNINFNGVGFINSLYGGIKIDNSSKNILINGCSFVNGGSQTFADSAAIRAQDSDSKGIVISNNIFYQIYGKAIYFQGKESQIINNSIQGCRYDGIYLDGGSDVDVCNNMIIDSGYYSDNTYSGIYCNNGNTNIISNNIKTRNFIERPKYAINLGNLALHNKIKDNTIPSSGYATSALHADNSATYITSDNDYLDDVAFSVKFNSDKSITHNSAIVLDFDKIEFDVQSNWDINNSRFVAPTKGIYEFNLSVEVSEQTNSISPNYAYVVIQDMSETEITRYSFYINSIPDSLSTDNRTTFHITCLAELEKGYFAQPKIYIDSDNDITIDDKSFFQGKKIR